MVDDFYSESDGVLFRIGRSLVRYQTLQAGEFVNRHAVDATRTPECGGDRSYRNTNVRCSLPVIKSGG